MTISKKLIKKMNKHFGTEYIKDNTPPEGWTEEAKEGAEQHERQKIKYLEDRLATLERSVGRINVLMHRFQIKERLDKKLKQELRDYKQAVEKLKPIITQLGRL